MRGQRMSDNRPVGARALGEWIELLADRRSAPRRALAVTYGGDDFAVEPAALCAHVVEEFGRAYGRDRGVIISRATGRINLLGMHVDHRGGSVNPIAIKEVFFVAEPRDDDTVTLRNIEGGEFPEERFSIRECLPDHKITDWEAWCHDELERRKDDPTVTWSNYTRAAVLYLQHLNTRDDGRFDPALRGMNVMAGGDIPRAAGLSTSSSIVVSAAEACIYINGLCVGPEELVDICGCGEWYVGTRGGSGDHAAIKFGRPNSILHMTCLPLSVRAMPVPSDYCMLLGNSLVEANKRAGARDAFNSRVASYIFGLMLVRQGFPQYAPKLEHLRDINPDTLGVSEAEIYRIIRALPERASREQVVALLPADKAEVDNVFRSHAEPADGYRIRQVCLFGVTECIRSDMAPDLLEAGDIEAFGEMLRISHDADRVTRIENGRRAPTDNSYPDARMDALIADAESDDPERVERARLWRQPGGYDCSCEEIDILVDAALTVPGVVGARLVGAGLGGSMVAITRQDQAQAVTDRMAEEYYKPRGLPVAVALMRPVGGSGVLDPG